jgi:hypothetical protein
MPHKLLTLCGWPVSQTDRRTTPLWTVWTLRSLKNFISAAPSDCISVAKRLSYHCVRAGCGPDRR